MAKYILRRSKAIVWCVWALTLYACATLPTDYERAETFTFQDTESTPIGRNLAPMVAKHPGESGFLILLLHEMQRGLIF